VIRIALFLSLMTAGSVFADGIGSYKTVVDIASQRKTSAFIYFSSNGCSACRQMEKTTFMDPVTGTKLRQMARVKYILDSEDGSEVFKYILRTNKIEVPEIVPLPSYFIVRRYKIIKYHSGYLPPEEFGPWLDATP